MDYWWDLFFPRSRGMVFTTGMGRSNLYSYFHSTCRFSSSVRWDGVVAEKAEEENSIL